MGTKKYEQSYDYEYYWKSCNNPTDFMSYYQQLNAIYDCKPKTVLEIGVGNKLVSNQLKSIGIDVLTMDINADLKPDWFGDIRNIHTGIGKFDVVCAFEVLEHIPFADFQKALVQMKNHSSKYVIISLPILSVGIKLYMKLPALRPSYGYLDLLINLKQKDIKDDHTAHYWEINRAGYSEKKILDIISKHFEIVKRGRMYMSPNHYMLVLKKKGDED